MFTVLSYLLYVMKHIKLLEVSLIFHMHLYAYIHELLWGAIITHIKHTKLLEVSLIFHMHLYVYIHELLWGAFFSFFDEKEKIHKAILCL